MKDKIRRMFNYILHGVRPLDIRANVCVSNSSSKLQNKNIVITGGGRGLGYNIAEKCIAEGARVLITGRDAKTLENASKSLCDCAYLQFDVTDFANIEQFFDKCETILGGPIHCLVNNAGISLHEGSIENTTAETFDKQLNTNLKAPYFLSKEFIRRYLSHGLNNGSILFVSSERGLYCDDQPYGIFKASINSLTEALGRRYINIGLRVNSIAPGVTVSDLTSYKKDGNLYRKSSCGGRAYLGEEVAEISAFLLSDLSGCISSQVIPCNRGNHLRCDW